MYLYFFKRTIKSRETNKQKNFQPAWRPAPTYATRVTLGKSLNFSLSLTCFVCRMGVDSPFLEGYGEDDDDIRYASHKVHSVVAGTWTALHRQDLNAGLLLLWLIVTTW